MTKLLVISLAALSLVFSGCSKSTPPAASKSGTAPSPATGSFTEAQVLEAFGWFLASNSPITELGLTEQDLDNLIKGFRIAATGGKSPYDLSRIGPSIDEVLGRKQTAYMAKAREKNVAEGVAYFAKLKDDRSVIELPSGLRYQVIAPGSGPAPKATDTVRVHYHGTFVDGTVFDSSVERGEPVEFPLNGVIPAWTEGMQKISKGGKIKMHVPASLGYGDEGRPGMPPASTLIFEVELLDINPPAAPALTTPATKTP